MRIAAHLRSPALRLARQGPRVGPRRLRSFDDVAGARTIEVETITARSAAEHGRPRIGILPGCRLATGGGVVVTGDGALVMESLWDEEHYRREFLDRPVRLPRPARLRGEHASLISLWYANYYHWMLDALPRLASLEAAGMDRVPLVVPRPLSRFQRESLALLGVTDNRLTPFAREHIAPHTLIWAPAPAHIGHATPEVVAWLRRRLGQGRNEGRRRLYVARAGARRVVNDAQVTEVVRRHGFEVIRPERMALREQIRAFGSAEAVVAPHGAGLTNIVFSRRLAVLELVAPAYRNPCFERLARAAGHEHLRLVADAVPSRRPPLEWPFAVPPDRLDAAIEGMLSRQTA
jgi:capsular polysaccharide biosynthesis protein